MMVVTSKHARAARGLLGWTQHELATHAGVGLSTVRDLETGRRAVSADKLSAIRAALEAAGVELIEKGGKIGAKIDAQTSSSRQKPRRSP